MFSGFTKGEVGFSFISLESEHVFDYIGVDGFTMSKYNFEVRPLTGHFCSGHFVYPFR